MAITGLMKGKVVNSLREKKQLIDWLRDHDISIKELKKSLGATDSLRDLAKLSDITNLSPARGWKRRLQLDTLKVASKLSEILKEENIEAFIHDGTLIGYIRHGGFIPWDDDMDFFILRPDYNRLIQYFENRGSLLRVTGKSYEEDIEQIDSFCKGRTGEPILIKSYDFSKFTLADNHVKRITIDFFPYDFIKEGTDFNEYKNYVFNFKNERKKIPREQKNTIISKKEDENPYSSEKRTSIIASGLDMIPFGFLYSHSNRFIPADYIYPMQPAVFEGIDFLIPAKPESFLSEFKCPDFRSYPVSFATGGEGDHESLYSEWYIRHGTKAELIIHSEEELKAMLPLYEKLRDANIFAEFINRIPEDRWGFITDNYEVRYSFRVNLNAQWAVTAGNLREIGRYKNNKYCFNGDTEAAFRTIYEKQNI